MKRPIDVLKKYDIILLDMDGVVTSEQMYWDSSALSVYEHLFASRYYGRQQFDVDAIARLGDDVSDIRRTVYNDDATITLLKQYGVNSNWDMTYIAIATALITADGDGVDFKVDFKKVYQYLVDLNRDGRMSIFDVYQHVGERLAHTLGKPLCYCERYGELWQSGKLCFQEWYLGDRMFLQINGIQPKQYGKRGLMQTEQPLMPLAATAEMLRVLRDSGKILGVGTGRIYYEISMPFTRWNLMQYFDADRLVSFTDVEQCESELPGVSVSKPHPFMFLKGAFGMSYDNSRILNGDYDKQLLKRVLVVGDAGADILAAQAAGIDFAAVLTGVSGKAARGYFEQMKAHYIFDDVLQLITDDNGLK